jgi:hypothetical protein
MTTSVSISYGSFDTQFVAGTFRVTAGLKNGITVPPTIDTLCRIIYSSEVNTLARTIQSAPVTPNQIEFYDTQGSRFCTLAKHRNDNTFGTVANVSIMPNVLSNIQFPEVSSDATYLVMSCYPGFYECASMRARKFFLEKDMGLLKGKYPPSELSLFVTSILFDDINGVLPEFWTQFKEVLVAPSNLTGFIAEYICGRYVTEKVSNSQHMLTFGSKVLSALFFNAHVKATIRTEGLQIFSRETLETNFIVLLENPDKNDIVVTDKGTGVTFQPTQLWSLDPSVLHTLIEANRFYKKFPNDDASLQLFCMENSSDVVKYMFCSPLNVFDTLKGVNEFDLNIITFAKGLRTSIYNKLNQFLHTSNPSEQLLSSWNVQPPHPQLLDRQHSCVAEPPGM